MLRGEERLLAAFDRLHANIKNKRELVPAEITSHVIDNIIITNSIDTGRMLAAMSYDEFRESGNNYRAFVGTLRDSEVYYDGFVEFDSTYPARFIYKDAIEKTNVREIFDGIVGSSFVI